MKLNKRLKPNLVDPILERRIIRTLNPPQPDYWAPTKNVFRNFCQNYLKQNIGLIIFVIIIILFLIYRYRVIRKNKEESELEKYYENFYGGTPSFEAKTDDKKKLTDYSNLVLEAYNQQKDILREPNIDKANFAYPMYPYSKGSLIPSGSRG